MAIRERKGRLSPWQVYWNNPFTGKRECANFKTETEAKKHDSLIRHRLKFERESFRPEEEENEPELTLENAYILYLKEKQFDKAGLDWQLESMKPVLQEYGHTPVKDMTREIFVSVMEKMKLKPNVKPVTVRGRLSVFRTVLKWCAERNLCGCINFPKLRPAEYERFIPPNPEEISAMLAAAPEHVQRVILLGWQCGVRIGGSELFRLTWNDVDFQRNCLVVHGSKKNKKASWREVPLK